MITGTPRSKTRRATKRSPAPMRSRARDDEQHDVDVLERGVDRLLHPLRERVHRALEPGQVGEHELPVGAVGDAEDAAARRVGHLRRDRDLVAAERVDERRLADVRPARDRDDAGLHARSPASNCSGRSSSTVIRTTRPPFRKTTRSTCISASHCRQPPHGEAVIAATLEVSRPVALDDRAREGRPLRADAQRIGGVLDVDALDHLPVAREHGAADVEVRVRRVRPRRDRVRAREELFVGHAAKTW